MIIAAASFNENMSVALDFADTLTVFNIRENKIPDKKTVQLKSQMPTARALEIKNLNIDLLICGCISRRSFEILSQSGIEIISHITGNVDDVINAYLNGKLNNQEFFMPGFGKGQGRMRRGRKCRFKNF